MDSFGPHANKLQKKGQGRSYIPVPVEPTGRSALTAYSVPLLTTHVLHRGAAALGTGPLRVWGAVITRY